MCERLNIAGLTLLTVNFRRKPAYRVYQWQLSDWHSRGWLL
jgi:hypothetical protein